LFTIFAFSAQAADKSILVYGDSLAAAYGISQERGWVALLGERLKREQVDYSVVNASVSGETTSGGLTRIKPALERHRPAIVIVELGANDGLRGLPVAQMKKNLGAIIEQSQQAGARVLLLGMRLPPNYGPDYTQAFEVAFGDLAKRYKTALVPFMLEDVVEKPGLFQSDRIHPTVEAQPLILERVWTELRPLLKSR
jgi:acyl-CoA thioesterase-1